MLTIGRVSKKVGLTPKTIRFYEETGIINKTSRSKNGYRQYPETIIEELLLLKYVRDLGLPLQEVKRLMQGCDNGDCEHSKEYIQTSINNYVHLLDQKLKQMQELREKLLSLSNSLDTHEKANNQDIYCCNILHQLNNTSTSSGRKSERR